MLDAKGRELKVGDEVVWATISYRTAELRFGEIETIQPRDYHPSFTGKIEEEAKVRSFCTKKLMKRRSSELVLIN